MVLAVSVADCVYASRVGKFTVWAELRRSLDLRGEEHATPSSRGERGMAEVERWSLGPRLWFGGRGSLHRSFGHASPGEWP